MYQKLMNVLLKKDIYVNNLESVIFDMYMFIWQTRAQCKGWPHGIEF